MRGAAAAGKVGTAEEVAVERGERQAQFARCVKRRRAESEYSKRRLPDSGGQTTPVGFLDGLVKAGLRWARLPILVAMAGQLPFRNYRTAS